MSEWGWDALYQALDGMIKPRPPETVVCWDKRWKCFWLCDPDSPQLDEPYMEFICRLGDVPLKQLEMRL
jgi:hypothetical protein